MSWREELAKLLYPSVFDEANDLVTKLALTEHALENEKEENEKLAEEMLKLNNELVEINEDLKQKSDTRTELEIYLEDFEVDKFAYANKGLFKKERFAMYPNELIQPEIFLVEELRKKVGTKTASIKTWASKVANFVDKQKKWTSDKDTDNYLDIYQDIYASVMDPKQDCENHASIVSSIEPEFGIAFGFAGTTGHAWNVFLYQDELWCIETNSTFDFDRSARVFKYESQDKYDIHWVFTKERTFKLKENPTNFGVMAKL